MVEPYMSVVSLSARGNGNLIGFNTPFDPKQASHPVQNMGILTKALCLHAYINLCSSAVNLTVMQMRLRHKLFTSILRFLTLSDS